APSARGRFVVPPISDYGLTGAPRTAALCSSSGSIDWLCLPRFDSEPVFGLLVGGEGAGCFAIRPSDAAEVVSRRYWPDSSVLEPRWPTRASELGRAHGPGEAARRRRVARGVAGRSDAGRRRARADRRALRSAPGRCRRGSARATATFGAGVPVGTAGRRPPRRAGAFDRPGRGH